MAVRAAPLLNLLAPLPARDQGPSRRGWVGVGVAVAVAVVLLSLAAIQIVALAGRDDPDPHQDAAEHFKYGSIGAGGLPEIPLPIFLVLPDLFSDLLPPGPGAGYARLGFFYEGKERLLPVGLGVRRRHVPVVALNCAACHAGTMRAAKDAPAELLPGAPANRFNSDAFLQFLAEVGSDPRFEPDRLLAAMAEHDLPLSWPEQLFYRLVQIPRTRSQLLELRRRLPWLQKRPALGPGRLDAPNLEAALSSEKPAELDGAGAADYPPLYNQRIHRGAARHWEGSDEVAVGRVIRWIQDLQPPVFPRDQIDLERAAKGRAIWNEHCERCHSLSGPADGKVTPLAELGTDPELAVQRKVDGYPNAPLDGVWARSPYLHNGSVPTLRALLFVEERPEVFFRGHEVFDYQRAGYVSTGPEAEAEGFRYDTRLRGNHNTGHLYGTDLPREQKELLLEYLKTL